MLIHAHGVSNVKQFLLQEINEFNKALVMPEGQTMRIALYEGNIW